ncbi:MAG: methionyl-tRNA formyltransferase [Candidatus Moraniibacteriota bacterium]
MDEKSIKLRVIFMGTSDFADKILKSIIAEKYNVISVYTQPDKKVGREQTLEKTAVKITAETKKIPVFSPTRFGDTEIAQLEEQKPDILIVAAYGKILPKKVLEMAGFGAINIHASLLPEYRGPSPIQNAILDGEKETGVTIMLMDTGIDTGKILSQKKITIGPDEKSAELSTRLAELSIKLLLETIPLWIRRKIEPIEQDESKATLCQLIERSDGKVMWTNAAQDIYNQYRAFFTWPGIFTYWQKDSSLSRIKLNKINFKDKSPSETHHIGEVFILEEKVVVQTGKGIILLEELQKEGKTNIKINDFVNGNPEFIGSILK